MTFRSNHYIPFCVLSLSLSSVKTSSLIHISNLHPIQGHLPNPPGWNIPHLGSDWRNWRADKKKVTSDEQHKNMAATGIHWLPVTDKSLILLISLSRAARSPSHLSAHAVGLKRFMIIPFDLKVWKASAIRLYYDQGHPGTLCLCEMMWLATGLSGSLMDLSAAPAHAVDMIGEMKW